MRRGQEAQAAPLDGGTRRSLPRFHRHNFEPPRMMAFVKDLSSAAGRWSDALVGAKRERAVLITLGVYGLFWMLYRILATWPRDIHHDMTEAYVWSRALAGGYDKHPPMSGWIVAAWFSVFPATDWAFTLLAVVNIVATLVIAWKMFARWLPPEKAVFGLAMLTLIPFYNFHALKFNANSVLLPFWALAAYAVMRLFEQRSTLWALIAGVSAGAAMLGKYWSVFLVAGLGVAALLDPRRLAFLRSPAPWIIIAAGLVTIAPHLHWLLDDGFALMAYASARMVAIDPGPVVVSAHYAAGLIAFAAAPVALFVILARPDRAGWRDLLLPREPQRRLMLAAFALPVLLPIAASLTLQLEIVALWMIPGLTLLPLVVLSSPRIVIDRRAVKVMLVVATVFSGGLLLLSPWISLAIHLTSTPRPSDHASLLAERLQMEWPALEPITHVAGEPELAMSVAFYLGGPVRYLPGGAGQLAAQVREAAPNRAIRGVAVCPSEDLVCVAGLDSAGGQRLFEGSLARAWDWRFGRVAGRPVGYVAAAIVPQEKPAPSTPKPQLQAAR